MATAELKPIVRDVDAAPVGELHEARCEDGIFAWDGRVLEFFSWMTKGGYRLHVENMSVSVGEPSRRGKRSVAIGWRGGVGGLSFSVTEDDWAAVGPLLEMVMGALTP